MMHLVKHADRTGDPLPDGGFPLSHIEVVGDPPAGWGAADTFVGRALAKGWVTFENMRSAFTEVDGVPYDRNPVVTGDVLVVDVQDRPLRYRVLEHPGRYRESDGSHRVSHEYTCELIKEGERG